MINQNRKEYEKEYIHGNPLQYSCLENPMDREDWQTTVHSVAELDTTEKTWHARMQYASKVWQG